MLQNIIYMFLQFRPPPKKKNRRQISHDDYLLDIDMKSLLRIRLMHAQID